MGGRLISSYVQAQIAMTVETVQISQEVPHVGREEDVAFDTERRRGSQNSTSSERNSSVLLMAKVMEHERCTFRLP